MAAFRGNLGDGLAQVDLAVQTIGDGDRFAEPLSEPEDRPVGFQNSEINPGAGNRSRQTPVTCSKKVGRRRSPEPRATPRSRPHLVVSRAKSL